MKVDVLVAEIGSTTTVVNAFKDLDSENPVFGHRDRRRLRCWKAMFVSGCRERSMISVGR